ncbi:MAG: lasso peptide biosynthesis B2 protein [Balneolaceae bacterium]|nr:MAG: lasso peptide biosynthesis B2 protein [Balneolaceae bacterium]
MSSETHTNSSQLSGPHARGTAKDAPDAFGHGEQAAPDDLSGPPTTLVRYLRKPRAERRMIREALLLSASTRFVILFLPFRVLRRLMKAQQADPKSIDSGAREVRPAEVTDPQTRRVVLCVRAVSRRVPWKATCLVEAASTRIMLHRLGIASTLWLGVQKQTDGKMHPHAWVTSGGEVVIGGGELRKYTAVSAFR